MFTPTPGIAANGSLNPGLSAATVRNSIGLGSVDNTSDANKPVSTAQASAIAGLLFAVPYVSGRYYHIVDAQIGNGGANAHNSMRFTPFIVRRSVTLQRLGIRIVTGAAGNMQLAIYASNDSRPSGAPLASTPSMSTASATIVESTFSGGNVTLQPGLYFIGANTDNASTVYQSYIIGETFVNFLMGGTSAAQTTGAFNTAVALYFISQTFGTWPTIPTNQVFSFATSNSVPAAFFQVA
jgi:hypothetical protein